MAVFEYKCSQCRLRKEQIFRKDPPKAIACPACGAEAVRQLADFGFAFADGKYQGNTGVDSLDRDVDKRVGRDAKDRWEQVKDRFSRKREVQRQHGGESAVAVKRTLDGDYQPLSQTEAAESKSLRREYAEAVRESRQARAKDAEKG